MADPNWREVYQAERAKKIETMKELRQRLGQNASDRDIERHVDKRMGEAMERVIRDRMHEPKK